jgi:hypothetical protein
MARTISRPSVAVVTLQAFGAQIFRDQIARFAVVLDHEDVGRCLGHEVLLSVIRPELRRIFVSECF